mmetsp:Transcript_43293/g.106920  ORF Transcript_43293/g.106920 Transcript_43293/m.106920 type:complete len:207 (-) Transcript_43293:1159-1779(-)
MSGLRPPPSFARSSPTRQGYCGVGLCSASSRTSARRTWTPTSRGRSFATLATPPMHWGCSHSVTRWTTPRTTARSGSCRRRCARRSTPTSTCRTAGLEPPASGRRERRSATSLSSTDISKRTTARRCSCAQSRSASRKAMGSEPLSRGCKTCTPRSSRKAGCRTLSNSSRVRSSHRRPRRSASACPLARRQRSCSRRWMRILSCRS